MINSSEKLAMLYKTEIMQIFSKTIM
uniref:Uncharacterized protein n=1 Tax=Anguilla anguilla TaxID=7936 RepID=A0A0E9RI79_ANGAN